ncbi:MAG TPA: putative lipid II flippase FtsW [Acidimicrobiia bacterium]|nr:putative lipid II flippase FtsW [Acidimicrobiia bacterium]
MAGVVAVPTRAALRRVRAQARGVSRSVMFLLVPVSLLVVIGLGAILSASSVLGLRETGDGLYYFKRQIVWLVIGVFGMVTAAFIPLRWWRRMAFPLFTMTIGLLGAVMVFGTRANGATRWLIVGPISIQPSEIAKLTTVLFLAAVVSRREYEMIRLRDFFFPVAGSVGLVAILVMAQPDLGTTLLISAGAFAVLLASAVPLRFVVGSAVASTGGAFLLAVSSPYRWARVTAFLDLQSDPLGSSYQAVQGLVALGTGGLWGVGLGASRARWSFLPNAHTDFVFAILGEETGLAGSLAVVALFTSLTIAGTLIAQRSTDRFGRLVAVGITTWLAVQAVVNIGGVVGVLPITGVPLPFVSFGGTALVVSLVGVGVLVSVARDVDLIEAYHR